MFMRRYNTLLVTGTTAIRIPIIKRAVVDYAVGADWTPAAGDVKVFVDAAAVANITNLPTAIAAGNTAFWEFVITAAELSCKQLLVTIADAATKAIEDQSFIVETYGNASAMYAADLSLANLPANVTQLLGTAWLTPGTAGTPDVNAKLHGGTAQTGRDIGASVLLSAGTGTGQLDFTSGVVKANLAQILGTALTETAGLLAGGFKKFFNVATPTGTANSLPDAVAGAAGGVFIAGANAATSVTTALTANITGNLSGSVGSVTGAVGSVTAGVTLAASAVQAIWDALTTALTAVGSIGKLLVDNLNAAISSRLATAGYTAPPTVGAIADQVWDEAMADHLAGGSTGASLNGAGAAGDPWTTPLPGAYGTGTAGKIIGTNINATVSSRALETGGNLAAVMAKTDNLPSDPADQSLVIAATDAVMARLGAPAGASVSADMAAVKADTAAVLVDTGTTLDGRIPAALVAGRMDAAVGAMAAGVVTAAAIATGAIDADAVAADAVTEIQAGLSTLTAAQVNAEVVDALSVDTYAEPGQGAPAATTTLAAKVGYLFKAFRNRSTQTSSTYKLYSDDAVTVDQKATLSDDATTTDRSEIATGP